MRTKARFFYSLLLIFFLQTVLVSVAAATTRIMPLGDSITKGGGSSIPETEMVGYRKKLYLDLINQGYDIDFVGERIHGFFADPDHNGWGGWHADDIRDSVYYFLEEKHTDIVLLHIGADDIRSGQSAAEVSIEINGILDMIDDYEADSGREVMVILARIINLQDPTTPDGLEISSLNDLLRALANNRMAGGDKIRHVNQEIALDYPTDMATETHPNMTGYNKMADVWYSALGQILPVANFSADPISGIHPLTVNFSDESTGDITSCLWNFGDGETSTDQNPSHIYYDPGTYTVSLTVSGPAGSDSEVKAGYITVSEPGGGGGGGGGGGDGGGGGGGCFLATAASGSRMAEEIR